MFSSPHPLPPRRVFLRRWSNYLLVAAGLMAIALSVGILGYHFIARLPWIDAILNAAMILTGMGPVDTLRTPAAKLFASGYALFSGIVFLSGSSVAIAPLFHRLLHRFHLEDAPPNREG